MDDLEVSLRERFRSINCKRVNLFGISYYETMLHGHRSGTKYYSFPLRSLRCRIRNKRAILLFVVHPSKVDKARMTELTALLWERLIDIFLDRFIIPSNKNRDEMPNVRNCEKYLLGASAIIQLAYSKIQRAWFSESRNNIVSPRDWGTAYIEPERDEDGRIIKWRPPTYFISSVTNEKILGEKLNALFEDEFGHTHSLS